MEFRFTKMHGLGNDFMVVDAVNQQVTLSTPQIRTLADRHFGVGFDQLLLIESPTSPESDFYYRIYNGDGSEVEQCGNGLRCVAKYIHNHKLSNKNKIAVETASGICYPELGPDKLVIVDMGIPRFKLADIPFISDRQSESYLLPVAGRQVPMSVLSMGNPHAVILVEDLGVDLANAPVAELGAAICHHPSFPSGVNVGFCEIENGDSIQLRVFERGVGETLACGTGACAAMVAARQKKLVGDQVKVNLRGGQLEVRWEGVGQPVTMIGPAEEVFEGSIKL